MGYYTDMLEAIDKSIAKCYEKIDKEEDDCEKSELYYLIEALEERKRKIQQESFFTCS